MVLVRSFLFCASVLCGIAQAMEGEQLFQLQLSRQEQLNINFRDAIDQRDISSVSSYLDQKAQVDTVKINGRTALIDVCNPEYDSKKNRTLLLPIIRLLLAYKADVNHRDTHGLSALEYATSCNFIPAMELLLKAGAQLHGDFITTPCHFAAWHGGYAALALLHEYGAPMDKFDKKGFAPLHCAINKIGPIKQLLEYGAPLDQVTQGVSDDGKWCGGLYKYPANSSAFHLAAHIHSLNNGSLTTLTRTKTPLLYHALFYGTMTQKDVVHFLCCIKRCSPLLYSLRKDVLIPRMVTFKPIMLLRMLKSDNSQVRGIATQTLLYRAHNLEKLLMLRDAQGHTAYDLERAKPLNDPGYAPVFNPATIMADCQAYIVAERSNSVAQLPLSNPFRMARTLIPQEPEQSTAKIKQLIGVIKKKLNAAFKK